MTDKLDLDKDKQNSGDDGLKLENYKLKAKKEKVDLETYVFIFGQSFPRGELVKLGLIALFIIIMSATGGYLYYQDWREGRLKQLAKLEELERIETEATRLEAQAAAERIGPLETFFLNYLEQTGMGDVESIRAVGVYTVGELSFDLTFLAKRPRLYRQTLVRDDHKIEFAYDGMTVWFKQSHNVMDAQSEELMILNKALAILESTIPCFAWDYDPNADETIFELMPDADWEGYPCKVIKNSGLLEDTLVYHFMDAETGFERYRRASIKIGPRRFKDVELFYELPKEGSAYSIPSGIELYLDGRPYYKIHFDSIEVNRGIPTFLFNPPI